MTPPVASLTASPVAFSPEQIAFWPILAEMTEAQLEAVCAVTQRLELPARHVILEQNSLTDALYVVHSGALRVDIANRAGSLLLFRGPGDLIGDLSMIDGEVSRHRVSTQTQCEMARVARVDFWNVLWPIPSFSFNFACWLTRRVRAGAELSASFALLDAKGRLARQIAILARQFGCSHGDDSFELGLRITQEEWAQMVGTSRGQINQSFAELRRLGLIHEQNTLMVPDVSRLEKFYRDRIK